MVSKSFYNMGIFSARSYGIEIFYPSFKCKQVFSSYAKQITPKSFRLSGKML